jgi:hypothetical protein
VGKTSEVLDKPTARSGSCRTGINERVTFINELNEWNELELA